MRSTTKMMLAATLATMLVSGLAFGRVYERIQALFADGTAAAPSVSFVSDPDTGVYRSAANTVGLAGNGAAAVTATPGTVALKKAGGTNSITSDTTAASASSTVAAVTLAPTATLDANDLVCEVNSAAGTSLMSVDLEGDGYLAGDLTLAGNGLNGTGTAATFAITSSTADATTSGTVGAITIKAAADIAANDWVLNITDSADTSILSLQEDGDLTIAGSFTFTPADVTLSGGDLTSSHATQSFNIVGQANDATVSTSVAAITLKASTNITANDLVLEVNDSADASLLTCDEEGDVVATGDITAAGNDFSCSGTGATCIVSSAATDATTSGTVGAVTLKATADIGNADLLLDVQDSAANHALTCTEAGALTALTSITSAGNSFSCSGAAATCSLASSINDATASSSVAAFTLAPANDLTAGDLILEVNDSGGVAQFALNEQGDGVFTGLVSSVAAETCADSGDGNPGTLTLEADGNVIPLTCSDANGCTITMAETGVVSGTLVTIINVSANTANFADTAGVTELTGAVALGQYDSLQLVYSVDRWVMVATSNN